MYNITVNKSQKSTVFTENIKFYVAPKISDYNHKATLNHHKLKIKI